MSITKYTNFDAVNQKTENEGKYLQAEDLFIVSKNETEDADFGECKYDVMEVSVYDVNNNLLPQKSGNNVAYIKNNNIANYMYSMTNRGGKKELIVNYEKLLKDLGFSNGILKINLNFVRYKVGSENELERVWIQEISPSREEIRILPLKTKYEHITEKNKGQFKNINQLNKDFKYYKKSILDSLNNFENNFLENIDSILETKFGKDFFNLLKKDFGLSKFSDYRKKIFEDYKLSVSYYLGNKYYDITQSNFGKPSEVRFEDCDVYDFKSISNDLKSILFLCVNTNIKVLKRRDISVTGLPKEFAKVETDKSIKDSTDAYPTPTKFTKKVYNVEKNEKLEIKETKKDVVITPPIVKTPIVIDKPPFNETPEIKILPEPKVETSQLTTGGGISFGGGRGGVRGTTNYFDGSENVFGNVKSVIDGDRGEMVE